MAKRKPTTEETQRKLEAMKFDSSKYIRLTPISVLRARVEKWKKLRDVI